MEKSKTSPGKRKKKQVGSAVALSEPPISVVEAMLSVHLWAEGGRDAPQSALAMVGDLLSASPCEIREGFSSSIAASFRDPVQAVNAARRIRRLVQGFSQTSKTGRLGGCFILFPVEETTLEVETHSKQLVSALTRFHSGQILVVGGLCELAKSIPGLRFEAVSAEWLPPEPSGPYRPVMQLMPPVQMNGYVQEPIDCWVPSVESTPQVAPTGELAVPAIVTDLPPITNLDVVAPQLAADPIATVDQEISGFSRIVRTKGRAFSLRWVAMGCATVVVLTVIAIRVSGSRRSLHPAARPLPTAQPVSGSPAGEPKNGTIVDPPPPHVVIVDPSPPHVEPKKPHPVGADTAADTRKDGVDKTGITFSRDEIDSLIAKAEKESGDGKFDDAISRYKIVLKHEPSNARAKEGLARAIRNRNSQ